MNLILAFSALMRAMLSMSWIAPQCYGPFVTFGLLVSRFTFNNYKHWSHVILHDSIAGAAVSIFSATGVTQGCPLAMIIYGLTLLPLIRQLQAEFPQLLHLWFADDGTAVGSFSLLNAYFRRIIELGPAYGYHVQPSSQVPHRHAYCQPCPGPH